MSRSSGFSLLFLGFALALAGCTNVVNPSTVPNQALTIQASGSKTVPFGGSTQLKAYLWNAP
jgi:hypothetical protein